MFQIPHFYAASIGIVVTSNNCSSGKNLFDALQSGNLEQCRLLYAKVIANSTNDKPQADFIDLRFFNDFVQELLRYVHVIFWVAQVRSHKCHTVLINLLSPKRLPDTH